MKNLSDVKITPEKKLKQLASQAPKEEKKTTPQDKGKGEKSRPGQSSKSTLGPLRVDEYLQAYGREFSPKTDGGRTFYRFPACLFDPSHKKNESAIVQDSTGKLTYHCFHDHCNHTWKEAQKVISGDDDIRKYREGFDPNWKPSGSKKKPIEDDKPFLVVSDKGRVSFVPALLADYLGKKYKPLINEGKDFGGLFYHYMPSGVWKIWPEAIIRHEAVRVLGDHAMTRRVSDAVGVLEDQVFVREDERKCDPMWINLQNCMLDLRTMKTAPHAPSFNSRVQLPVMYKEEATCPLWLETLAQIFLDDLEKARVLQDFFGYCLYPKILFPCTIFQIGGGANGKGTVQRVLEGMLGDDNVSHISLTRMEEKFGPVELKDKLLNACGETSTKPLEVTRYKEVAAGDKVQAEVKYKNDVIFIPIAKHMISMNEFPGIKDKTDAFFRRVIVMEYKQQFQGEEDDTELSEKLLKEYSGIFMWALEGLKRVLETRTIALPESVIQAKKRFRARVNPVIMFVDEECILGEAYQAAPKELYGHYKDWCEESKIKHLGKQRFYEQLLTNFKVNRTRPTGGTTEVFEGVGLRDDDQITIA